MQEVVIPLSASARSEWTGYLILSASLMRLEIWIQSAAYA